VHTAGWPLDSGTHGGGLLHHLQDGNQVITILLRPTMRNPTSALFEEMQRWKTHPSIKHL
jgi:electron-transferring-flavoprotein dehydrogenase